MNTKAQSRPRGWNLTKEHQRKAQAARSYESLAESGRKGFERLIELRGIEFIHQNAAKWRQRNPNRFERQMMSWLDARSIAYARDERVADVRYCDFVLHEQRTVIEVDGPTWHTNNPLHGEDREGRDKRQDAALCDAGWTVIRISTKQFRFLDEILKGVEL